MAGIRSVMIAARERAGLSQRALARQSSWLPENVSKFEAGQKGASIESIDDWLSACRYELIPVPAGAVEPVEVAALPPEHQEVLVRLARLYPSLSDEQRDTILSHVERWEKQRGIAAPSEPDQPSTDSPTIQDRRAKSS